jgi:hypothetical protein
VNPLSSYHYNGKYLFFVAWNHNRSQINVSLLEERITPVYTVSGRAQVPEYEGLIGAGTFLSNLPAVAQLKTASTDLFSESGNCQSASSLQNLFHLRINNSLCT